MVANNGLITHQDLQDYEPSGVRPFMEHIGDYEIWSMPPPSSGGVLLVQMLNMLEPFDLGQLGYGKVKPFT